MTVRPTHHKPAKKGSSSAASKATTHHAPAERKREAELERDIVRVTGNPVINGVMTVANGLLAVLNEQRQVIAVNDAFLKQIGVSDARETLGLRLGECLGCVHACEMEGGCGTSKYCSTCGAVMATMSALTTGQPQEQTCALTLEKDLQQVDLYFSVRTYPMEVESEKYLLLFMQDITMQQHRACLDRTFFHDINNVLCGLIGKSHIPAGKEITKERMKDIQHLVERIAEEIAIHNSLQNSVDASYRPMYAQVPVGTLLKEIAQVFEDHALARGKKLTVAYPEDGACVTTDFHLASRVIVNMVTNALEATPDGGSVTLDCINDGDSTSFRVWNQGEIPEDIARRVFQLNFSTKGTMGRGFGTYSMKLFGEKILGGIVKFETEATSGTTFSFTLPSEEPS